MKKYQVGILCAAVVISPLFGTAKAHAEEVSDTDTSVEVTVDNDDARDVDLLGTTETVEINDTSIDTNVEATTETEVVVETTEVHDSVPEDTSGSIIDETPAVMKQAPKSVSLGATSVLTEAQTVDTAKAVNDTPYDTLDDSDVEPEPVLKGWQKIDGKQYFYVDGVPFVGFRSVQKKPYYFDKNGVMQIGWFSVGNAYYYADRDGVLATGKQKLGKYTYIFDKAHAMKTGWTKFENNWYYLDSNGHALSGWVQDGTKWYYFDKNFQMVKGWQNIKNQWYFFRADGSMHIGWQSTKGKWYYLMPDTGRMRTGWLRWKGEWYYFDKYGAMKTGWLFYKNKWYYLTDNGMISGKMFTVGKKEYFASELGNLVLNQIVKTTDGSLYYFQSDGSKLTSSKKFEVGSKTYISDDSGKLYAGKLIKYSGTYYYMLSDGSVRFLPDQKAAALAASYGNNLEKAMKYAGSTTYGGKHDFDESWGSTKLAEYGITHRYGNCYVYAAIFRDIAYAMGYDAHQISGRVNLGEGGFGKHSWVEIDFADGNTYCYDPAGLHRQGMANAYHFKYKQKGTWVYDSPVRMN